MTELDDLKAKWGEYDRKLDATLRLNRRLLDEVALGHARSALGRVRWRVGCELVLAVIAVGWLGGYLWSHLAQARFAAPAATLFVGAIASLHGAIRQAVATRIDPVATVAKGQRQIEALRRMRATYERWQLLLAPVVWTPLAIVALEAGWGVDAWVVPGVGGLAANLAFGLVTPLVAIAVARRYGARWRSSRLGGWLVDELTGRGLAAAAGALAAVAAFEDEPG